MTGALDASAVAPSSYLASVNTLPTANYRNMRSPAVGGRFALPSDGDAGDNGDGGDDDSAQTGVYLETLSGALLALTYSYVPSN